MGSVLIVAIVFGSIVTLAGLLCLTILLAIRIRHSSVSRKGRGASKDETEVIQEIYRGLESMEERIEALETILMDNRDFSGENNE